MFRIDPAIKGRRFSPIEFHVSWNLAPLLFFATNGEEIASDEERRRMFKHGGGCPVGLDLLRNAVLQWGRNTPQVMRAVCGPGGYETWQFGEGGSEENPREHARGLYMGSRVRRYGAVPSFGFFRLEHGIRGVYSSGGNAFVLYEADIFDRGGWTQYATIELMCRVAGAAPEGLEKPPRRRVEIPDREPDYAELHHLAGKRMVLWWSLASEDWNLRHVDEADPRGHGPMIESMVERAVIRNFLGHDPTRVREMFVPGILNPFYGEDEITIRVWDLGGGRFLCRAMRWVDTDEERHILDAELLTS